MKITSSTLNIPPYISTSWENILSIFQEEKNLIILLHSKEKIKIPNLDQATIETIFSAHAKYLEQKNKKSKLKIIPLGGLEQVGMNITLFEYENDIVIVDCGIAFPTDEMLGIDLVIPDTTYLKNNRDKVRGIVFTHGHEDHIGATPYILREVNVPIYGTTLPLKIISP